MQLKKSMLSNLPPPIKSDYPFYLRDFKHYDYLALWQKMQQFTETRNEDTRDEVWLVEHNPVYTLGQRATYEDIIHTNDIPVVHTNRGGRVTYHGPGQLVIYPLLNLKKLKCHLRMLVDALENTTIRLLKDHNVKAYAEKKAPGIYIEGAKVASVGLRIHKGYSYHGLAINIDMDLTPFDAIYPCGLKETPITQLIDWIGPTSTAKVSKVFLNYFCEALFDSQSM